MSIKPAIELDHIVINKNGERVLSCISLEILQEEFVIITGNNGTGKTTLLNAITGLEQPSSGMVKLFGTDVRSFKKWTRIGYLRQQNLALPPVYISVKEYISTGVKPQGKTYKSALADVSEIFNIEDLTSRNLNQLSGGQRQRVELARTMLHQPDILLLDEPTSSLDKISRQNILSYISRLREYFKATIVMVTHHAETLDIKADRTVCIDSDHSLCPSGSSIEHVHHSHLTL